MDTPLAPNNISVNFTGDRISAATVTGREGRTPFTANYKAGEHEVLLEVLRGFPSALDAPEKSPIFVEIVNKLKEKIVGFSRLPTIVHGHLSELLKSLKSGIRVLSLREPPLIGPSAAQLLEETELIEAYYLSLLNLLMSDKTKFNPPAWWSINVVKVAYQLVIEAQKRSGASQPQNVGGIVAAQVIAAGKFRQDTENREKEISRKRLKLEQDEAELKQQRASLILNEEKKVTVAEQLAGSVAEIGLSIKNFAQADGQQVARIQNLETTVEVLNETVKNGFASISLLLQRLAPPQAP